MDNPFGNVGSGCPDLALTRGRTGKVSGIYGSGGGGAGRLVSWLFGTNGTMKRCYFKKRTGEVVENKGLATKNKPERTEKRTGEVL